MVATDEVGWLIQGKKDCKLFSAVSTKEINMHPMFVDWRVEAVHSNFLIIKSTCYILESTRLFRYYLFFLSHYLILFNLMRALLKRISFIATLPVGDMNILDSKYMFAL